MNPMWLSFLPALAASLLLTPFARILAMRIGAVDRPDGKRKLHKEPVPLLGGVAVYLAVVVGLLAAQQTTFAASVPLARLSNVLILAAGFVCLLGCIDDRWDLNARFKLLLQVVSVLPIVLAGCAVDRIVAFGYPIELGWLGIPLTVCWLVGCINALNLLDGMDGLASVIGIATCAMLAIIASATGHPHVALIAIVLAGSLTGFLIYNLPPASIYLGDSGSMVIGLVVGMLGIQGAMKTSATLSITAPAVVMSIPMLDAALAIVRRKLTGQPFHVADRGHIHHRLLNRGLSTWQALCIIGALCLTTGAAATAATILRNDWLAWATAMSLFVLLVWTRAFGHYEFSLLKLSMAAQLDNVVRLLVAAPRARRRPTRGDLTQMNFDQSWAFLIEEISLWQGRQVQLTVRRDDGVVCRHLWVDAGSLPDDPHQWSLSMTFGNPPSAHCEIRVAGPDAAIPEPLHLLRIARLMQVYGQHWVLHADEVPETGLKVVSETVKEDGPTLPFRKGAA